MTKCTDFPTTYPLYPGQLIYSINNQGRDFGKLQKKRLKNHKFLRLDFIFNCLPLIQANTSNGFPTVVEPEPVLWMVPYLLLQNIQ